MTVVDLIEQSRIEGFQQLRRYFREYDRPSFMAMEIRNLDFEDMTPQVFPDLTEPTTGRLGRIAPLIVELTEFGDLFLPAFDTTLPDFEAATNPATSESIARSAGDVLMERPWQWFKVGAAVLPKMVAHVQAAEDFASLCDLGGSLLTHRQMQQLPSDKMKLGGTISNAGRFLAVMFWSSPIGVGKIKELATHGTVIWQSDPFNFAADVIERCGLTNNSPQIISRDVHWPAWAGHKPVEAQEDQPEASQSETVVVSPERLNEILPSAEFRIAGVQFVLTGREGDLLRIYMNHQLRYLTDSQASELIASNPRIQEQAIRKYRSDLVKELRNRFHVNLNRQIKADRTGFFERRKSARRSAYRLRLDEMEPLYPCDDGSTDG